MQASGTATLLKRNSGKGAFPWMFWFFKNILFTKHFRAAASGCCTIGAFYPELNQIQISRSVIARHCFFEALYFNCSYLISKVTISYLFAGKCVLLISIKISSLSPFLRSFNIELKTSLLVGFVTPLFRDNWNLSLGKTSTKE